MDSRVVYLGLFGGQVLLALLAAVFALLGYLPATLVFAALALAIGPILAHVRMRRFLAALRRVGGSTASSGTVALDSGISTRLSALETSLNDLSDKVDTIAAKQSDCATGEASKYANEIRREARAIRLMLHEQPSK